MSCGFSLHNGSTDVRRSLPALGVAFCVISIGMSLSTGVAAQSFWERSARAGSSTETELRRSVERVVLASGDSGDLRRARLALISLQRGTVKDPRTAILLIRLHRDLSLPYSAWVARELDRILACNLGYTEKAWAHLEYAHVSLERRDSAALKFHLNAALAHAWAPELRAEILVLRGWTALRLAAATDAKLDFSLAGTLAQRRSLLLQILVGTALSSALHDDRVAFSAAALAAFSLDTSRARVSQRDAFVELSLTEGERKNVHLVLKWGQYLKLQTQLGRDGIDVQDVEGQRLEICRQLSYRQRPYEGKKNSSVADPSIPGREILSEGEIHLLQRLRGIMTEACRADGVFDSK